MAIAITDSARLKQAYAGRIGHSLLIVVAIHLLLFYFAPTFEFKPYELLDAETTEIVSPDDIVVSPAPRDVAGPVVAIEPAGVGEDVEDVEIPRNAFGDFGVGFTPQAPESEQAKEFIAFDQQPLLISAVRPVYPELSKQAGVEGRVLLHVLVDADGIVRSASVLESDVTPAMEKAALAAAWHFKFLPARQGAVSVKAHMVVPVVFRLH